jgi:Domain of unknown function (DUF4160)
MPNLFTVDGFRFFFYSNEGDPREPVHVHIRKAGGEAKIWIDPEISVQSSYGFSARELRFILDLAAKRRLLIRSVWNDHFGD